MKSAISDFPKPIQFRPGGRLYWREATIRGCSSCRQANKAKSCPVLDEYFANEWDPTGCRDCKIYFCLCEERLRSEAKSTDPVFRVRRKAVRHA